jgi:demethylmenaquinone methyltransferase/2-methoxy-6-polyprenyl-1,4-benzoquinol methylase
VEVAGGHRSRGLSGDADLVARFFPGTGSSYDRCVRTTTLGLDARWKRRLLARLPRSAGALLDLACGTGIVTADVLRRWPRARVVGVDVTPDYLAVARERLRPFGDRVRLLLGDATTMPLLPHGPFDAVVSSYLPKYVDGDLLLENLTPAVVHGGCLALHDFTCPGDPVSRTVWEGWFAVLHALAPRIFPGWEPVFDGSLAALVRRTTWVEDLASALPRHGWTQVRVEPLTFGAATVVSARRPRSL